MDYINFINQNEAIKAVENLVDTMSVCISLDECNGMRNMKERSILALKELPSIEVPFSEPCDVCRWHGLEDGDKLYRSSDWDGGIGFDYIRNIHYCPVCGRRLS